MLRTLVFCLTILVSTPLLANTACPQHFAAGKAPVITNPKMQARTQELCFQVFAVLHSGISRTPLYSAEHLTRKNMKNAGKLSRKDSSHAESALHVGDRAELRDYAHSGYDRGHQSPNGDMPTRSSQAESFSLANMVPQLHAVNAGVWEGIEGVARNLAISEGDLYVVSGLAFIGGDATRIGEVLLPTHFWKVIYSPEQHKAGAYLVAHDDTHAYSVVTVSALEKMVGLSLLPGVPKSIRDAGMDLPQPSSARRGRRSKSPASADFTLKSYSNSIIESIERASQP